MICVSSISEFHGRIQNGGQYSKVLFQFAPDGIFNEMFGRKQINSRARVNSTILWARES